MTVHINIKKALLLLIVSLGLLLIWLSIRDDLILKIAIFLLSLIAYSSLEVINRINSISFKRNARVSKMEFGKYFDQNIELTNTGKRPIRRLEIDDQSNLPGSLGSRVIETIETKQSASFSWKTLLTRRGLYKLGPTHLSLIDSFGLIKIQRTIDNSQELVVLPATHDIKLLKLLGGAPSGKSISKRQNRQVSPQTAGVREYFPGDDLNRIHWPYSAKRNTLMVKEFDQDEQESNWIILDAHKNSHFAITKAQTIHRGVEFSRLLNTTREINLPQDTIEYAVAVAASTAKYYRKDATPYGFFCSAKNWIYLSIEKGERQFAKIMQLLAFIQPEGKISLAELSAICREKIVSGSSVIFITPRSDEQLVIADNYFNTKRISRVFFLIDSEPIGGPAINKTNIELLRKRNAKVFIIKIGDHIGNKFALNISRTPL